MRRKLLARVERPKRRPIGPPGARQNDPLTRRSLRCERLRSRSPWTLEPKSTRVSPRLQEICGHPDSTRNTLLPLVALALLVSLSGPASSQDQTSAASASRFAELRRQLEAEFPGRAAVGRHAVTVAARLTAFADAYPGGPEAAEALVAAAEAQLLSGAEGAAREARTLWRRLAVSPAGADFRARGIFLEAEHDFSRRPSDSEHLRAYQRSADRLFQRLVDEHGESRYAAAAKRSLAYLSLLETRAAPPVSGVFDDGSEVVERDAESTKGRVVLLLFWHAGAPIHRVLDAKLVESLAGVFVEYPILDGHVDVLCVSTDTERERFEAARRVWRLRWPQLFDGKGFETPLARSFSIPTSPHLAVVDGGGRLAYLGENPDAFLAAASEALKAKRIALESDAAAAEEKPSTPQGEGRGGE